MKNEIGLFIIALLVSISLSYALTVTLIGPCSGCEDSDGIADFTYNASRISPENLTNCSLYIDNNFDSRVLSPTAGVYNTFRVNNIKKSNSLNWFVSCNNDTNNVNSSTFILDTQIGSRPPNTGEGGGMKCTTDVKQCPDGSFVSRNVNNNCEFFECPQLELPIEKESQREISPVLLIIIIGFVIFVIAKLINR